MHKRFYVIGRGPYWVKDSVTGIELYDNEPHGKDKPLRFEDEEKAIEYAARCNENEEN